MTSWRLLLHGLASPAHNMAVDEALLREVNSPVLRLYGWDVPAVSLGYFQPWSLAPSGRPFIRRYTGGGLVDHTEDVTYTIVLPRSHPWMEVSAPESYCIIHRGVQAALNACGIISELTPEASTLESEACFQKPVRFDIVAGESKLSGAAQRRTREGMLHQGSILLQNPTSNADLRGAFPVAFAQHLDLKLVPSELTDSEACRAHDLELSRYAMDDWNKSR